MKRRKLLCGVMFVASCGLSTGDVHTIAVADNDLGVVGLTTERPETVPATAALASPIAHVDSSDPPFLLLHSRADTMVPIAQSRT